VVVQEYFAQKESLKAGLCYDIISMICRNFFCVSFVGVGYYFALDLFGRKRHWAAEVSLTIGMLIFTGVILKLNGAVDLRGMNLGNLLWFLAGGVSGSFGVIFLCRILEKLPMKLLQHFLVFMGCNSLLIMVTHLDFRVLYVSIRMAEWMNDILLHNRVLFCIIIVLLVVLLETVIIALVHFCRKILAKNKKQIS
jgi:hypothetical protein